MGNRDRRVLSMEQQNNQRKLWIQAFAVSVLIAVLVGWFIWSQTKPLNSAELKIPVAGLRSYGATANLLSDQTLQGKTTQPYFEAQLIMLRDKVSAAMKTLDSARVQSGLEIKQWQARRLVRELSATLDRLESSFSSQTRLADAKRELETLVTQLKELESTLEE